MEQTDCSETSAYKIQTPGNNPEESIKNPVLFPSIMCIWASISVMQGNLGYWHLGNCTVKYSERPNSVKFSRAVSCIRWLNVRETVVLRIISPFLWSRTLLTQTSWHRLTSGPGTSQTTMTEVVLGNLVHSPCNHLTLWFCDLGTADTISKYINK